LPYTRIGTDLFEWPAWAAMSPIARCVWLGLYASPEAHLMVPGFFRGGIALIAEAARVGVTDAQTALNELKERRLILTDDRRRTTLMTELPDRGQRPSNGRCVVMYHSRWLTLPRCELSDLWVHLLLWLCQPMTRDHEEAWDRTFGRSTPVRSNTKPISPIVRLTTKVHGESFSKEPVDKGTQTSMFPQEGDTVSDTVSDTPLLAVNCSGVGKGKGGRGGKGRTRGPANGRSHPFLIRDLFAALRETCGGRVATAPWDPRMAKSLWATIDACGEAEVTLDDVRLAGEWLAAGGLAYREDLGIPWIAKTGELLNTVAKARVWDEGGRPPVESRKRGGGSKPVTADDMARRAAMFEAQGE
jgi:hypothetical protein